MSGMSSMSFNNRRVSIGLGHVDKGTDFDHLEVRMALGCLLEIHASQTAYKQIANWQLKFEIGRASCRERV